MTPRGSACLLVGLVACASAGVNGGDDGSGSIDAAPGTDARGDAAAPMRARTRVRSTSR